MRFLRDAEQRPPRNSGWASRQIPRTGAEWLAVFVLMLSAFGCDGGPAVDEASASSEAAATTEGPTTKAEDGNEPSIETDADAPFVLGDLIKPFDPPPTLEALEASKTWVDSPVVDAMARLRKQKQSEPPLVSVEQALAMKNESEEANQKILSALSVLPSEEGGRVDYDATINRSFQQDLRSTNPVLVSSMSESEIASMIAFALFGFDWAMNPFASADSVVSWRTSEDRMVDLVVLRDDLTWSDGKPITARDVEFSYRLIMSSAVPVPAMRAGTSDLQLVKAYDDRTVAFFHKKSSAVNVWSLNFTIVPEHVYADSVAEDPTLRKSAHHIQQEKKPVVGGPYGLESHVRGQEVVLARRESFYKHNGKQVREIPYFKQIRYRILEDQNTSLLALKSGDLDETLLGPEQWTTQTSGDDFYRNNTKVRGEESTFFYVCWNLKSPFFDDLRVRRAMAHAMNYEEMLDDLCFGLFGRSTGIFDPQSWAYPKEPPQLLEYDLDRAEDLLDEAGWGDSDGDGIRDKEINGRVTPFEFSLIVSNKPDRIAICNLLRENLESIGVLCRIAPLEAAVLQERSFQRNFQAMMAGWGAGADPYISNNIYATPGERNYGSYSNAEVDRLFAEAEREFDREKRAEMYGRIHHLIYADQPYMFLYTRSSFYAFNKQLRGYRFSPRGAFSYSPGFGSIWRLLP
ncbi:ABC transporter substrate-binding protein [Botrimarina hoheduenensis]|uniref:Oligopeptide-binding protein AppA n=1 Tax=Botrimarina hoheduenensis TaxID=2528000 RepID=A0A5C5W7X1_9BACT|nr:ABC transporter substrate-binding protein [Botrimarina hoheduenensis]TWT46547.1 Oligopeptide-binding protein AppA precursor [Botrimarina hoheduenensis]